MQTSSSTQCLLVSIVMVMELYMNLNLRLYEKRGREGERERETERESNNSFVMFFHFSYCVTGFIDKNKDPIYQDFKRLLYNR